MHGLFVKPEKCEFHSDLVEYLGYCLSPDGLTMSPDKIQTISDWPEPRKVNDIQSFLGFANFYHQFIFNYSNIMVPLTRSPRRMLLGISLRIVDILSTLSSTPSLLCPSSPTSFWIPLSLWKLMPPTTLSLASCLLPAPMERSVRSRTTPRP